MTEHEILTVTAIRELLSATEERDISRLTVMWEEVREGDGVDTVTGAGQICLLLSFGLLRRFLEVHEPESVAKFLPAGATPRGVLQSAWFQSLLESQGVGRQWFEQLLPQVPHELYAVLVLLAPANAIATLVQMDPGAFGDGLEASYSGDYDTLEAVIDAVLLHRQGEHA